MEAHDYLRKIEKYDYMIENRKHEIQDMRSRASLSTVTFNNIKVQTSKRPDMTENLTINYIEREEILKEDISRYWQERQEIIRTMELLGAKEYGMLYCLYVEHLDLQEAADRFDRSYRWAVDVKRKALNCLQKILDEREKNEYLEKGKAE